MRDRQHCKKQRCCAATADPLRWACGPTIHFLPPPSAVPCSTLHHQPHWKNGTRWRKERKAGWRNCATMHCYTGGCIEKRPFSASAAFSPPLPLEPLMVPCSTACSRSVPMAAVLDGMAGREGGGNGTTISLYLLGRKRYICSGIKEEKRKEAKLLKRDVALPLLLLIDESHYKK